MPNNNELAISKIPILLDVPYIFWKNKLLIVSEFIKVILSNTEYIFSSTEENKLLNNELIEVETSSLTLIWVDSKKIPPLY